MAFMALVALFDADATWSLHWSFESKVTPDNSLRDYKFAIDVNDQWGAVVFTEQTQISLSLIHNHT